MLRELEKFYNTSWVHFRLSLPYFHRSALTSSQPELLQRRRDAHERRRPYLIAVKYMSPSTSLKTSSDRGISLRPCSPLQPALCFRQLLLSTDLIVPTFTFSFDIHPFSSYQKVPHRKRKFCNPHPRPPSARSRGRERNPQFLFSPVCRLPLQRAREVSYKKRWGGEEVDRLKGENHSYALPHPISSFPLPSDSLHALS